MTTTHLMLFATLAVCLFTFAARSRNLEVRVMHGDEANQAVRAGGLIDAGVYHYDPTDHHGPVMYYAAIPFCKATAKTFADTTERNFRMVPVAFSLMTLLLMLGLYARDRKGLFTHPAGVMTAIGLTALSPAMNYYSRFFIQETMFVTFLTGMLVCAVHYVRAGGGTRKGAWMAGGFGACLGLAAATKETIVLSVAAAGIAALCACGFRRLLAAWNTRDFLIMLGAAALVMVLFFSSFFTYPKGLYDAVFATFGAYAERAVVEDHTHPWNFYLRLLFWHKYSPAITWTKLGGLMGVLNPMSSSHAVGRIWSEAGVLIPPALLAAALAFAPRRDARAGSGGTPAATRWLRFAAVYTLALTAIYSAIPYKTPWCMLAFLHGYILLAGIGVGLAWERVSRLPAKGRWASVAAIGAFLAYAAAHQGAQAYYACFKLPADIRNPFVYAHTSQSALDIVDAIEEAAQKADGFATSIAIATPPSDTWPLPWYLRKYTQVGYWSSVEDIPPGFEPAILVVSQAERDPATDRFSGILRGTDFGIGIRPSTLLNIFLPDTLSDTDE
ncbi:MAG: TIGR03663 family protein [Kiritimatiellaeota bacterium]|nr:TIGR03663 family protein [Kiritimatiellota bacterium]